MSFFGFLEEKTSYSSGFSASSTAEQVTQGIDGTGLTAIVTGASSGIGLETARVLALRGVRVVMAVRNVNAGKKVKEDIINEIPTAKIEIMELDLSSMESVRKFATEYNSSGHHLHILINNAGIYGTPFMLSTDNIELQFATNHIGPFLLTNLLLETMKKTVSETKKEGRIVNVSSVSHDLLHREGIRFEKINDEASYNSATAYGQSKLANVLHANELARRFKDEEVNITANSLHPGVIDTNIMRHRSYLRVVIKFLSKIAFKNIPQGASTQCYVALHPQLKGVSGKYFVDNNETKLGALGSNVELARKLWDFSLSLTNSK